jgi:quinol monooxygenase YgiN
MGVLTPPSDEARAAQPYLGLDLATVNADGTITLRMPTVALTDVVHTLRWIDVHPITVPGPSRRRSSPHSTSSACNPRPPGAPGERTFLMTVRLAILALLDARPGKGDELAEFLRAGRELAAAEPGTVTWYAFKISETRYGIFDTFETSDARDAHLAGQIPQALSQVAPDLLAGDPDIRTIDIVAVK